MDGAAPSPASCGIPRLRPRWNALQVYLSAHRLDGWGYGIGAVELVAT